LIATYGPLGNGYAGPCSPEVAANSLGIERI